MGGYIPNDFTKDERSNEELLRWVFGDGDALRLQEQQAKAAIAACDRSINRCRVAQAIFAGLAAGWLGSLIWAVAKILRKGVKM